MTNPFADWSRAKLFAFTYKEGGEETLRKVLETGTNQKELLIEATDELERLNLPCATIVAEYIDRAPSRFDESNCPYLKPPYLGGYLNKNNISHWRAANERYRKAWEKEREIRLGLSAGPSQVGLGKEAEG